MTTMQILHQTLLHLQKLPLPYFAKTMGSGDEDHTPDDGHKFALIVLGILGSLFLFVLLFIVIRANCCTSKNESPEELELDGENKNMNHKEANKREEYQQLENVQGANQSNNNYYNINESNNNIGYQPPKLID